MKKDFLFLFYVLAGIIAGSIIANVCAGTGLSWLAFGQTIGFSPNAPAVIDLAVFKLTFGFSMSLTVAHIITISLALLLYRRSK